MTFNSSSSAKVPLSQLAQRVESLLQSSLDPDLTAEYRSAIELIPETVRKESKVADFLWIERDDPTRAATRLAMYWKRRKELYGERWLLPMTMTGIGTLESRHIDLLRTGYIQMIPNEEHGTVMVFDFTKLPPGVSQIQHQIHFYLLTITAPSKVTVMFLVRTSGVPQVDLSELQKQNVLGVAACHVCKFYVVQVYEDPARQHLLDFLGYKQRRYCETIFRRPCAGHIAEASVGGTVHLLQQHGFNHSCLPQDLGGTLNRSNFDQWIRSRLSVEEVMGANLVTTALARTSAEYALLVQKPSRRKRKTPRKQFQRTKERLDIVRHVNETDQAFEKRKNACYARRNYHRRRMEIFAAEGEIERYRAENKLLQQDNARLERLLSRAKGLVETNIIDDMAAVPCVSVAGLAITNGNIEPNGFQWDCDMLE